MKEDETKIKALMRRTGTKPGDLVIAGAAVVLTAVILYAAGTVTYTSRTRPAGAAEPVEQPEILTGTENDEETNEVPQHTAAGREE